MSWPSDRLKELAHRREQLSSRAAAQRAAIAGTFHEWRKPLGAADRVSRVARSLRAHPLLFSAAVAALVALPAGRLASLVARGLTVWRLWQTIAGSLAGPQDRKEAGSG